MVINKRIIVVLVLLVTIAAAGGTFFCFISLANSSEDLFQNIREELIY